MSPPSRRGELIATQEIDRQGTSSLDGRYQFTTLLGRGGMGEVWRAMDRSLDRYVAVKVPLHLRSGEGERWLAAEAQAVARLSHTHLVSLLDHTSIRPPPGIDRDRLPALVFQYVRGRPLRSFARTPQPWPWVRSVAEQMLEALAYAHGRGVVHRDLKPGNVLLAGEPSQPKVKILDFGIATWSGVGQRMDEVEADEEQTVIPRTSAAGTFSYMAPEQVEGGDIGPWTDLYSFGLVVAELLIGQRPFPGDNGAEVWQHRLRTRFAPPTQALSGLGVPLRRLLTRLLSPDPAQRFGWAADVRRSLPAEDVEDLAEGPGVFFTARTDRLPAVVGDIDQDEEETDPTHTEELDGAIQGEPSITMELAPVDEDALSLPAAWQLDRPDPQAWEEGAESPAEHRTAPFPAASYNLFALRDAPLYGRSEAWTRAWNHLARLAEQDRPTVLLIEGPQGRGKTRFARELAAVAEEVGVARAHHVRFRAEGSGAAALRRLLHRILRVTSLPRQSRETRVRRVLMESGYPSDGDLVPRLMSMLRSGRSGRRPVREEASTFVELLQVLGRRRPLLLWFEDIDRAQDLDLLILLQLLLRSDGSLPVAVVATRRDDLGVDAGGSASEWEVVRADKATLSVELDPLDDEAVARVLGFTAGASYDLGMEIARWSPGDPRGATQVARHMHESGRLVWTPDGYTLRGDTPSTAGRLRLDSILVARSRDLLRQVEDPDATRTLLNLLALVKERAAIADLYGAAERLGVGEERTAEAIGPLVTSALVEVRDEGPRLVHTALARRLGDAMDLKERMACHRAWASVLEGTGSRAGHAERLLEAAQHRESCGQAGAAARDEAQAAQALYARWELEAALRATERALGRLGSDAVLLRKEEEADLLVLRTVLDHDTSPVRPRPSELAGGLDMLLPMWASLPPSEQRCRCDLAHAEALQRAGRSGDATEALERALEGARGIKSSAWACRVLIRLSEVRRLGGDLGGAEEAGEEAHRVARRLHSDTLLLGVLLARLPLAIARGDARRARLWLDKLRALLRARASWQELHTLWRLRGEVERIAGDYSAARQAYLTALTLGRRRGLPNAPVRLSLVAMALAQGDLDGAQSWFDDEDPDRTASLRSHALRASRAIYFAELCVRRGDLGMASSSLQDAEILQRQAPIADPDQLASLGRTQRAVEDEALKARVAALSRSMQARIGGVAPA